MEHSINGNPPAGWEHTTEEWKRCVQLAELLKLDVMDVVPTFDNQFEINPRTVKIGDGPEEVKENCALVRQALELIGVDHAGLTIDRFYREQVESEVLIKRINETIRKMELAAAGLPSISPPYNVCLTCGKIISQTFGSSWPCGCKGASKIILRMGISRRVYRVDFPRLGKANVESVEPSIKAIEELEGHVAALSVELQQKITYEQISRRIQENEKASKLMKFGCHNLLNTLYFLMPNPSVVDDCPDYRLMLSEAWENKKIIDRRKDNLANDGEYLVLTEEEANEAWDESLDSFLDDCVLSEIDANIQEYFDRDAWKKDARVDERGHSLSSYDGAEYSTKDFVVFRIN